MPAPLCAGRKGLCGAAQTAWCAVRKHSGRPLREQGLFYILVVNFVRRGDIIIYKNTMKTYKGERLWIICWVDTL